MSERETNIGASDYDTTLTYEDYFIERKLLTGEEICDTLRESDVSALILDDIYNV